MTDSSEPKAPRSSRKKPSREPATIDLKATVVDAGAQPVGAAEEPKPEDTAPEAVQEILRETLQEPSPADSPEPPETTIEAGSPAAEEVVASPQGTIDSAMGTDSLSAVSSEEPLAQDSPTPEPSAAGLPPRDEPYRPAAPERRTSPAALLGAGLLGGLIGAGALYGLQTWQQGVASTDDQRLAQLEQRVGALGQPNAQQGNLQAIDGRIRALEAARAPIDQRLQALQATAERAASQAGEALNRPQPAAAPQNAPALDDLGGRVAALENQARTAGEGAARATQALEQRLGGLDQRLGDLDRRLAEQDQRAAERERRLTEQQQALAERDRRAGEQDQRLAALSRQVTEANRGAETASQAGIRVILSERLTESLRSGAPLGGVLEGLKKAGADPARLAPLEPFAQKGAPTAAQLAQSFKPLQQAILREDRSAAGDWTDRLLRMADRVVTVRPVNEPGATGVPSLVTRIEQALERGNVVDAAAAWDALPEPARRLSEEWGRQVKAVAQAAQASQAVAATALETLNRSTQ